MSVSIPVVASDHAFAIPSARIARDGAQGFAVWRQSKALLMFRSFIDELSEAVTGRSLLEPLDQSGEEKEEKEEKEETVGSGFKKSQEQEPVRGVSAVVRGCVALLEQVDAMLAEHPRTAQPTRYGNKAFRAWFERVEREAVNLVSIHVLSDEICSGHQPFDRNAAARELAPYVVASLGNYQRIDYGTGHEAAFAIFMLCLRRIGIATEDDNVALVTRVFNRYILLMRKVQDLYLLEPAGSHGVWGLDDYQFLPFLWGAAQLIGHPHIKPKSIHSEDVIKFYGHEYMYLAAIDFINKHKSGPFGEHSPLLYDISHVPHQLWKKLNYGLTKTYDDEVLNKFPVIQHTLFGSLFPLEVAPGAPNPENAASGSEPPGTAPWASGAGRHGMGQPGLPPSGAMPPSGAAPWAKRG